ncbi:hypothetical protein D3C75_687250 [compost metagenome]
MGIFGKMSRNPVQQYANPCLMQLVDEIHQILRFTITAGRRKITCALITPGQIIRMFGQRHEFYMGIAHFHQIGNQQLTHLPISV